MQRWYLICTRPGQETQARDSLQGLGLHCFLPLMPGAQPSPEPLFPRYLFVQLEEPLMGQTWAAVRAARGVARIVSISQEGSEISHDLVQFIRSRSLVMAGSVTAAQETPPSLRAYENLFAEMNGFRRVMALIELLSLRAGQASRQYLLAS